MNRDSFSPKILLCGFLALAAVWANADTTAPADSHSLTVKQHLIKWMLTDQKFVDKATIGGLAEIDLSTLALQKSQNSQVLNLAKIMIHDHTQANEKLKKIAQDKNIAPPAKLDNGHQDDLDKLKNLNNSKFDAAYLDIMEKDHENAISLFTAASVDNHLNAQLRQFAQETLPTLHNHENDVKKLENPTAVSTR